MDHRTRSRRTGNLLALGLAFVLLAFSLFQGTSSAGEPVKYPARPVRILVPAGAGGSLGREIRTLTPFLEKRLGVSLPVEYITGADGMICYNKLYQEKPDGYTLISFNLSSAISIEVTRDTAKYEVKKQTPVAVWNVKTHVFVTHPDKWKTFAEFLNDAKKKPVSLAVVGGSSAFQGYLMESALGLKINWVPYMDSAESMAAVAGKHADGLLTFTISPIPMIRAGRLRPLNVFSLTADPILPDVPNMKDVGHTEVPLVLVYGVIMTPPNTPKEYASILETAIKDATSTAEFKKLAENTGITVNFSPASELQKLIAANYEILTKYKQFIR